MSVDAADVRAFVLGRFALDPDTTPDDYDLRANGHIDSFGVLELIADIEERFEISLDFEDIEPEEMVVVGSLSRYVESKTREAA